MDLPSIFAVNPDDLYDLLMVQIEPDLVIANVKKLDAKYKKESENERVLRMKRYQSALEKYKIEKQLYLERSQKEVQVYIKDRRNQAENESQKDEEEILANLETMFT